MDIQENAVSVTGSTWSINLRGDSYCRLPVRKGGKFLIEASKGPKWSNGPVATETDYGPEGHKTIFNGVTPAFPLGALIGTLSAIKHEGKMDGDVFRRFFSPAKGYPILPIWCGFIPEYNGYEGVAPFSGYLYMVMNDENSFADNVGAINLTVKM